MKAGSSGACICICVCGGGGGGELCVGRGGELCVGRGGELCVGRGGELCVCLWYVRVTGVGVWSDMRRGEGGEGGSGRVGSCGTPRTELMDGPVHMCPEHGRPRQTADGRRMIYCPGSWTRPPPHLLFGPRHLTRGPVSSPAVYRP